MKNIFVLLFLSVSTLVINAQAFNPNMKDPYNPYNPNNKLYYNNGVVNSEKIHVRDNAIYVSYQPVDFGWGIRGDYQFIYSSLSYGNYEFTSDGETGYIDDHFKLCIGGIVYLPFIYDDVYMTGGVSFNSYGEYGGVIEEQDKVLYPISCELGIITKIDMFSFGLRVDPIKFETTLDIGIRFK